jgi:hypothetical protein
MSVGMRRAVLLSLAAFPGVLALLALAAEPGRLLPGLPYFRYNPLDGDAYGYFYAARAIIEVLRRDAAEVAAAVVVAAAILAVGWRRAGAVRVVAVAWAAGVVTAAIAHSIGFTGAAQLGWPLVWAVPMLPLRLVGEATPDVSYVPALAISLVCNAATVLASYAIARRIGFRENVALFGAALVSLWPILSLLTGPDAAKNGTWQNWLGLSLYTEPLSTALVTVALALVVGRNVVDRDVAVAGALLGLATFVRLSNVLIVGCAVVAYVVLGDRRRAIVLSLAAAAWAPAVLLFWPEGYPKLKPPVFPAHPFALSYVNDAWSHSYLWHPLVLVVLIPIALLGIVRASRRDATLLWACVAVTAVFYSFYEVTPMHPRFLFVILPIVLVFWAAGVSVLVASARKAL